MSVWNYCEKITALSSNTIRFNCETTENGLKFGLYWLLRIWVSLITLLIKVVKNIQNMPE